MEQPNNWVHCARLIIIQIFLKEKKNVYKKVFNQETKQYEKTSELRSTPWFVRMTVKGILDNDYLSTVSLWLNNEEKLNAIKEGNALFGCRVRISRRKRLEHINKRGIEAWKDAYYDFTLKDWNTCSYDKEYLQRISQKNPLDELDKNKNELQEKITNWNEPAETEQQEEVLNENEWE